MKPVRSRCSPCKAVCVRERERERGNICEYKRSIHQSRIRLTRTVNVAYPLGSTMYRKSSSRCGSTGFRFLSNRYKRGIPVGMVMPLISSSLMPSICLMRVRIVLACETMIHLFPARSDGEMTELKKGMMRSAVSLSDSARDRSSWSGDNLAYL